MRLIYEIAGPGCYFLEVPKEVFDNPPQIKGGQHAEFRKRILVEATPEQIAEGESDVRDPE